MFRLSSITEPHPNLIVLKPDADLRATEFPAGDDSLLVVEVSRHMTEPGTTTVATLGNTPVDLSGLLI